MRMGFCRCRFANFFLRNFFFFKKDLFFFSGWFGEKRVKRKDVLIRNSCRIIVIVSGFIEEIWYANCKLFLWPPRGRIKFFFILKLILASWVGIKSFSSWVQVWNNLLWGWYKAWSCAMQHWPKFFIGWKRGYALLFFHTKGVAAMSGLLHTIDCNFSL